MSGEGGWGRRGLTEDAEEIAPEGGLVALDLDLGAAHASATLLGGELRAFLLDELGADAAHGGIGLGHGCVVPALWGA